ncbi:MAG: hypothetical protein WCC48_02535 [Anaeromyxobacteraceae bacterium]
MREQAIAASRGADGWLGPDGREAFDLVEDRDGDGLRGREGLLVGEAEDLDSGSGEGGVTLSVIPEANVVSVLGPVDLDGELKAGAVEVQRVGSCGRLPSELGSEVAIPEDEPDARLGVGRGHTLKAAEVDRG